MIGQDYIAAGAALIIAGLAYAIRRAWRRFAARIDRLEHPDE